MEDLEGGNLWWKLEVLRCLPSHNGPLLHRACSQSFQVVGCKICVLWNYQINIHLTIQPTGTHYLLAISVNHDNLFSHCDLTEVYQTIRADSSNISVTISVSMHVLCNNISLWGTSAWSQCMRVQLCSFCPVEPGSLRPRDHISCSTNPSQSQSLSCLVLPEGLCKFVATRPMSTGAHPSFYLPSLSLQQPRGKFKDER
jgi:hypothetical protein